MRKMLCVGINNFLRPGNSLSECVADAEDMAVIGAMLGTAQVFPVTDAAATKNRVMTLLDDLVAEAQRGDLSYLGISWSGHGTHYNRQDGLGEALVCYDCDVLEDDWNPKTIIKDTELRDLLNQVPPTCTVELWLDTCYSGGMDRGFTQDRNRFLHNPGNLENIMRVASPNATMNVGLNSNIIMWCACSEAHESADAPDLGNGAFTYYWVEAFKANPRASRVELLLAARAGLRVGDYDQLPRLKCWNTPAQGRVGV